MLIDAHTHLDRYGDELESALMEITQHQAIARELPMIQLLTETDNPGGQKWLTGAVGMPQVIRQVIHKLAELKEADPKEVIRTIEANFIQLIRDDPWLAETRAKPF